MADLKDDIERYLKGELSPAERHALERKALDDPFLADALEGAQTISSSEFVEDLEIVRHRLKSRQPKVPVHAKKYWYYAVAASLVLVIGVMSVLTIAPQREESPGSITMNNEKEDPAEGPKTPGDARELGDENSRDPEPVPDDPGPSRQENRLQSGEGEATGEQDADRGKSALDKKQQPQPEISQENTRVGETEGINDTETKYANPTSEPPSLRVEDSTTAVSPAGASNDRAESENTRESAGKPLLKERTAQPTPSAADRTGNQRFIKGTVSDAEDRTPLPGVNVYTPDGSIGTITDINGDFEIEVRPETETLSFSFIGLLPKEVSIRSDDPPKNLDVQLNEDVSQLSEVVVTGYGNEEDVEMENIQWVYAEPAGGRKAYREYLEENLHYPEKALENEVEGKVSIQFTIEPSGSLSEFRVVRSLGHGCDEEVMRLIKEGPEWNPTKRNDRPVKSRGKIKMRFTLPDNKK